MNDLISKRAVLAKINLWANGGCDTDKLIESIKKMSGGSLTDRPCEYCKNHVDGRCAAWDCAFDDVLSSSEKPNKCEDAISRQAVLKIIDGWYEQNRDTDNIEDLIVLITYMDSVNPQKPICPSEGVDPAYEKMLNKWIGAEVLDRIRNEMHATAEKHEDGVYYLRDEWVDEIIDKYAEGSEKE